MQSLRHILMVLNLLPFFTRAQQCLNARGLFKVKGEKYNCKDVQKDRSLCHKQLKFKRKCPALCGECDCKDTEGRFISEIKGRMTCKRAANKKETRCNDKDTRMYCPQTCGMCADSYTVAPTASPKIKCSIKAEVEFDPIWVGAFYGSYTDRLVATKSDEEETCKDGITDWGCFHDSDAVISKSPTGDGDRTDKGFTQIIQGADGTFIFNVHREFDDPSRSNQDGGLVPSSLTIFVNDDPKAAYTHTSHDKQDLMVSVDCDSNCNCIIEKEEACSLVAELKYPEDPGYFGYHKDDVTVTKLGSEGDCDKNTVGETSWGCHHVGDAVVWNPENLENNYYGYNFGEIVEITNMYNSTVYLDVRHQFHRYYESYYDYDHRIQATLRVYVDGQMLGSFTHPKNNNIDTHRPSGKRNPRYKANYKATVICDSQCICQVTKLNY